jgi:hypothetical protein
MLDFCHRSLSDFSQMIEHRQMPEVRRGPVAEPVRWIA